MNYSFVTNQARNMSKAKKILKRIVIGVFTILFIIVITLEVSIPYGKSTENKIENPGMIGKNKQNTYPTIGLFSEYLINK